jgi:hypothetical protein
LALRGRRLWLSRQKARCASIHQEVPTQASTCRQI